MMEAFNIFGRVVIALLGAALVFVGVVWTLQAFKIAFNTPRVPDGPVSFMVNNRQWAIYGTIAVLVGLGQFYGLTSRAHGDGKVLFLANDERHQIGNVGP
jgi:hypothetical protein